MDEITMQEWFLRRAQGAQSCLPYLTTWGGSLNKAQLIPPRPEVTLEHRKLTPVVL